MTSSDYNPHISITCSTSMQSSTGRLNGIIMFGLTVLLCAALLNHFHSRLLIYNPQPDIQFKINEVTQFRDTSLWQQLSFKYDLKANLSSLYNWNLKQLFVYIEVMWVNEQGLSNRMVVTDWILESPDDRTKVGEVFRIDVKNKQIQYTVRDVHHKMKGRKLDVVLVTEFMPIVGFFYKTELYRTTLQVPQAYK